MTNNTLESPAEKQLKTIIDGEFRAITKYSMGINRIVRLLRKAIEKIQQTQRGGPLTNSISMITHGISLMSPHLQNEFCMRRMKSEDDAKANHENFQGPELFKLFTDFMGEKVCQYREYQPNLLMMSEEKRADSRQQEEPPEECQDQSGQL